MLAIIQISCEISILDCGNVMKFSKTLKKSIKTLQKYILIADCYSIFYKTVIINDLENLCSTIALDKYYVKVSVNGNLNSI